MMPYRDLIFEAMLKEAAAYELLRESNYLYKLAGGFWARAGEYLSKVPEYWQKFRTSKYFWPTVAGVGGLTVGGLGGAVYGLSRPRKRYIEE